jgi:hypothetical protein
LTPTSVVVLTDCFPPLVLKMPVETVPVEEMLLVPVSLPPHGIYRVISAAARVGNQSRTGRLSSLSSSGP